MPNNPQPVPQADLTMILLQLTREANSDDTLLADVVTSFVQPAGEGVSAADGVGIPLQAKPYLVDSARVGYTEL